MREILFRGKTEDNKWIYGVPLKEMINGFTEATVIAQNVEIETIVDFDGWFNHEAVDPETIGQFTGLTDKNGTKIFEGDICSTDLDRPYNVVKFSHGCFVFSCNDGTDEYEDIMIPLCEEDGVVSWTEVVGNIYDNPELLEN